MRVRRATADDAVAIASIYAPYVSASAISFELEPPSPEDMGQRMLAHAPMHAWLVAETGEGGVVGYAYSGPHRSRPAYRWGCEVSAYVRGDAQGTGVGRALYAALIDLLAGQGYTVAYAGIVLPNRASIALHEAMGFRPFAVFERVGFKRGAWHDVGWWVRDLAAATIPPPMLKSVDEAWPE